MNRFLLLALTAGLLSPIAAKASKFPELKVQPQDASEWFHIGNTTGKGSTLCTQWVAGDLTLERAIYYRDGILGFYKTQGKRAKELSIAGFNQGIVAMQNLGMNKDYKDLEGRYDKCDQLKFK